MESIAPETLQRQLAELKKKYEQLQQENQELQNRLKLSSLQTKSYHHDMEAFYGESIESSIEDFPIGPDVSPHIVETAWKSIGNLQAPDLSIENSIQAFFNRAIPLLLKDLGTDQIYSFFRNKELRDPRQRLDGVFGVNGNSWEEVVFPLKVKIPSRREQGIGQAINYMSTMLEKQAFLHRFRGICVYTDWTTIVVCLIDMSSENRRTKELELFGTTSDWTEKAPTSGFHLLCRILAASYQDHGFKKIPSYVHVGSQMWPVEKLLGQGGDSVVYQCKNPDLTNEDVCVKVPIRLSRSRSLTLRKGTEAIHMNRIGQRLDEDEKFILPTVLHNPLNALVTRPVGVPLTHKMASGSTDQTALGWGIKWLESLRILHEKARYVHNDARPENAVVASDDKIMLIDFQNTCEVDSRVSIIRFGVPQIPDRWLPILESDQIPSFWRSSPWDDIEQFVYGMSYLLNDCEYMWMRSARLKVAQVPGEAFMEVIQCRKTYFEALDADLPEKRIYEWFINNRPQGNAVAPDYDSLLKLMNDLMA